MIDLEFIIVTLFLVLNILALMVKEKNLVFPSVIMSIFSIIICIYYIIDLGFDINIESLYCTFVAVVSALTLLIKGNEEY